MANDGESVQQMREQLGWSRRKLASKYGTTRRRIRAIENNCDPKPKKEQSVHKKCFIPFLGYEVFLFTKRPIADRSFDLEQQTRNVFNFISREV